MVVSLFFLFFFFFFFFFVLSLVRCAPQKVVTHLWSSRIVNALQSLVGTSFVVLLWWYRDRRNLINVNKKRKKMSAQQKIVKGSKSDGSKEANGHMGRRRAVSILVAFKSSSHHGPKFGCRIVGLLLPPLL